MDSSSYKIYHVHGFDPRQLSENFFSSKDEMVFREDLLVFPVENLKKVFTEGHIEGDILIDLSCGSLIHHLYAACEFFKHIIVLKVSDSCIMELKRWLDTRTGAFDWGHVTKMHVDKEGSSDQLQDKEGKVRSAVQHVMKCDIEKENLIDPMVLPPADCITIAWLLDHICGNYEEFRIYIRKFSRLLNPGGHLIIIGSLGKTYIKVGKDKFRCLTYDEDFVRDALVRERFVIDYCNVKKRTSVSDLNDYKAVIFIAARKEKTGMKAHTAQYCSIMSSMLLLFIEVYYKEMGIRISSLCLQCMGDLISASLCSLWKN